MTHKQRIKSKIKEGWHFQEIKYEKPEITIYQLEKKASKTVTNISYIVGKSSLRYFPNARIVKAKRISVAGNFIPYIPNKGCAIV